MLFYVGGFFFQINAAANVFLRVPAGQFSAYHGHTQRHIMETLHHGSGWTGDFYVRDCYKLVTLTDLKNKKPTRCHLLFYCTSYRLNMFRALLCPSSGARGYVVDYHIGRFVLGLL